MNEVAERYHTIRERFAVLAASLGPDELTKPVPACPDWRVHDLLAHVTGIVDDALHGRTNGIGTPEWTAAQVERGRGVPTAELLARWAEQAAAFEALPLPPPAAIDLATHEQDLRSAVGRPGARDSDELHWAFRLGAERAVGVVPGLRVEAGGTAVGPSDAPVTLRGDRFELFRVFLGRRSLDQVRALEWDGGLPESFQDVMLFGPAAADVIE